MENKLLLPARYAPMDAEELCYTTGGVDEGFGRLSLAQIATAVGALTMGALYVYNYAWGLNETRNWIKKNKSDDAAAMAEKALADTTAYLTDSLFNCVRGIVTAMQLTSLFPITAVGWLTAL